MAFADSQSHARIKEHAERVRILLAGTVSAGDVVGYSSGWKRAIATTGGVIQARLVALENGVSGGRIWATPAALVENRHSGATPGGLVYVAESTNNGQVTQTAPSTTGDANTPIGFAISADTLYLSPGQRGPDSVA